MTSNNHSEYLNMIVYGVLASRSRICSDIQQKSNHKMTEVIYHASG